jgi:hypothetical protein
VPGEYRIDKSERVVYSRAWGVFTDEDLAETRASLFTDPAFSPDFAIVIDLSDVTELRLTSRALLNLAMTSRFAPTVRRAIVVSSDVAYGMARMFAILTGREERVQVFRDRASALEWLEVRNR